LTKKDSIKSPNNQIKKRRQTMKKSIWILGLTLVLFFIFGLNAHAQPKEVTEPVTTTWYATAKVLPLEEGRLYMSYEAFGVNVNDTGEGLFHNATSRVLGAMIIEKGIYKDERGWGVFNLQNGDKVFYSYTNSGEVKPGGIGTAKVTFTFTGGTGKCAGIKGGFEGTRYSIRPAFEGVGQSYNKGNIKYKLL
jgi:hypothetical protein